MSDSKPQVSEYQARLAEGVRGAVGRTVPGLDSGTLAELMRELFKVGEVTLAAIERRDPPQAPLACQAGCAHCCRLYVQVTPLEVIHLATAAIQSRTEEQLEELKTRVGNLDKKTHGMRSGERTTTRLPCALLEDEKCIAYEDRPFSCRGANSFDVELCRKMLEGGKELTTYSHQRDVWFTIGKNLTTGIEDAGQSESLLELTAALKLALEHKNPLLAWQTGALNFASARCVEARPPAPLQR